MRKTPPRSLAAGLAVALTASVLSASGSALASTTPQAERRMIVMLAGDAAVTAAPGGLLRDSGSGVAAARRGTAARQDDFLARAKQSGVHTRGNRKLNLLVNAVAVTVPADEVGKLSALPGVVAVYPDAPVRAYTDVSVPLIGATDVWKSKDAAGADVRGAGVTVAIIDSGVDYTHPDLGGGFGEGHKVVGGWDFVNNDADPMDDNGHGTHVAGIIAGRAAAPGGITGVAPDASILAYKAMNEWGEGSTSDIVAAIEAAIDPANPHRADVINMSLGGPGDGTDPLGQAATAATRAGVVVVASAGNSGPGRDTVGSPAAADGVIAVGASTSNFRVAKAYLAGRKPELIQTFRGALSANPQVKPVTAEVVDLGYGAPEDWDRVGDVRGKILKFEGFVARTTGDLYISDLELAREAERRGAVALLGGQSGGGPVLASVEPGVAPVEPGKVRLHESGDLFRMDSLVILGMDGAQFAELGTRMAAGRVDITITSTDSTDEIASFSSRGPSGTFGLKPDLVAPGVEIRSTVPKALFEPGQYRMSGTSMAGPHVAGAAALLRQLHPGQAPADVKSVLMGTSKSLRGTGPTAQGAGRLDIAAAAKATLTAQPPSISLGLADLSGGTVGGTTRVALHNSGTRAISVRLDADRRGVTVRPDRVAVPAGGSATVTVTLRVDRPEADTEIAGAINATAGTQRIHLPYLLVVRPLIVRASPDPSDGHSTVYIGAPTGLAGVPTVTVDPQHGRSFTVPAKLEYGNWYRAEIDVDRAGAYAVSVRGRAATGQMLVGASGFEVTPESIRRTRWEPIGPDSAGGSLTLSPAAPHQAMLAEEYKAGPWLTTDDGATWKQLNRLPIAVSGGEGMIVADPRHAERFFYAVNGTMNGSTVLRTDDRGTTWRTLNLPNSFISAFLADPAGAALIAVTDAGLQVSRDAGDSWTAFATGVTDSITDTAVAGGNLYLGTPRGIYVVPGIVAGAPQPTRKIYDSGTRFVSSIVADGSVIAAEVWNVGVVGSRDGGTTWSTLLAMPSGGTELRSSGGDVVLETYLGTSHVSHDHGATWVEVPAPSRDAAQLDYDRWADGTITMTNTAGVYRGSADGTGYRRIGVQGTTAHALAVSGGALLAGTELGVYRTALPVASREWGAIETEGYVGVDVTFLAVSPKDQKIVWRVRESAFGEFYLDRSTDAGLTWEEKGRGTEIPDSLLIDPADPNRVSVGFRSLEGAGLFRTVDGGTTWKNLYHDMTFTAQAGDPADPKRLWLGNELGLFRSDDGGATVTKVLDGPVRAIDLSGRRMVVGGDGVRVSTDGGRTFRAADTGPLDVHVSSLLRSGTTLYAGTTGSWDYGVASGGRGVLRSTDGGMSWENISSGLQNLDVVSLAVTGGALYVGTVSGGVHRLPLH
ncbi:subtilisin family serine protease [Allocatelliglobosispora scoriae]|uniref:Subtilisin family serine protease n=1 Tax=Allocatelliglobosispora scoriae TaxID=643052 RepID=A0A841BUF5_9ACTN|nr:S8 family serine peptidase [Allocatelliglobosispora scoriae]MBB5870390.1 subtilisin family serine protease [Allocatelliglobosispora scoriae]